MALTKVQLQDALDQRILGLFLLPTEQCNFRCTYCYEDFKHKVMPPGVVQGVKRLISERLSGLHILNIAWFGGEPMLAMHVIEDISQHILDERLRQAPRITYQATITTNGWRLNAERARRLAELGIQQAQISLDGLNDVHDQTRRRADGKGTFQRIWSNLIELRNSTIPLNVMIRLHLSPANYGQMEKIIQTLNSEFASDARFTVLLKAIARLGGPNDSIMPVYSKPEGKLARQALSPLLDPRLLPDPRILEDPCYAVKPNTLVIRSDGSIAKCTVAFNDDRNRVGILQPDGTIAIDQDKMRLWMRGLFTQNEEELACPFSVMARNQDVEISRSH
jgi:uncharacterized protein